MTALLDFCSHSALEHLIEFDLTLARGLNYYTGAIIEVKAKDVEIGSICGGGRYDDLTGIFGLKDVSGVGISFGADRIYDVMDQLDLFPPSANFSSAILFANFGPLESMYCIEIVRKLQKEGIAAEIYPESVKLKKQLAYANSRNIPFTALAGEDEIKQSCVTLRNMSTSEQSTVKIDELIQLLKMQSGRG
jgi:histidyl-tRNA synthetase